MKIEFHPYDFEYKVEEGLTYFYFYAKLKDGEKVAVKHHYQPYFYASLEDVDINLFNEKLQGLEVDSAKVVSWEEVEKELLGKRKKFYKIFVNYPKAVPTISKKLQSLGIESYEKDILFVHRYLRDNKILPMSLVQAEGEYLEGNEFKVPLFLAEKVKPGDKIRKKWKILAVDIETYAVNREIDTKKNPILMIALHGRDFKKVLIWKNFEHNLDYLEIVDDEAKMLERFREIVSEFQPDILTGYFSDGFDLPYIRERAEKNKVRLGLGLDHSEMVVVSKTGMRSGQVKIRGILHLDMLKFIKNIFGKDLRTDSYSLDNVSKELLNHQKHDVNLDNLSLAWDEKNELLPEYCEYNLHDANLTYKLCEKLLPDMIEFTTIIGVPTYDVIRMSFSRLVESYIMKRSMEYSVIAPNRPGNDEISQRMDESIQGGYVYEPTPGLYEDIVVFDFRSLYPTIITAHNIGPESFQCSCCGKNKVPGKEEYWFCEKDKKFIPSVLEKIILKRVEVKKLIKESKEEDRKILEAKSYALKILANSFYGYLGFYGARWYCLECAASTTAYARNYIKSAIRKAEKEGFGVVYADTDSCFLLLGKKTIDDAMRFMDEVNRDLPGRMELEFEGHFIKGIFVALKGTEKGAKKKYALMTKEGKLKITGFEFVRRNWSELAKEAQQEVLRLVLQDKTEEAFTYARKIVRDLKEGKIELRKLVLKTQITRDLSRYTSIGPHVKVAKDMVKKGYPVPAGTLVEYVIGEGSGLVRERAKIPSEVSKGGYDAEYYLKHQLIPAVSSIFLVLGYSEEEVFSETSQTGLGKFF